MLIFFRDSHSKSTAVYSWVIVIDKVECFFFFIRLVFLGNWMTQTVLMYQSVSVFFCMCFNNLFNHLSFHHHLHMNRLPAALILQCWIFLSLSVRLNILLGGMTPLYFHIVNVCLHCSVTCLLMHMCESWTFEDSRLAFVTALLFAVHPVHTEAVSTWHTDCHPLQKVSLEPCQLTGHLLFSMYQYAAIGSINTHNVL